MNKNYNFDSLTGLKGLFCLVIVFFHTLPDTDLIRMIAMTSLIQNYGGTLGNYFFFLSSGVLIATRYRERIFSGTVTFQDFLAKRLCKLYPLYLISNLAALVLEVWQFGWSGINIKKIVFTVLLQCGGGLETTHPYNGPAWFISALFVCYLVYFFIACHAKNTTQYYCMVAAGIIWGYSNLDGSGIIPMAFARQGESFFCFFIGCVLAEIYPRIRREYHKWLEPASLFCILAAGFLMLRYGVEIISGDSRVAFACFLLPLMLYFALYNRGAIMLLTSRPIQYLGKISFSVYLWHYVVYVFYHHLYQIFTGSRNLGNLSYLLYLGLMLVVSILSHLFIEKRNWTRSNRALL